MPRASSLSFRATIKHLLHHTVPDCLLIRHDGSSNMQYFLHTESA